MGIDFILKIIVVTFLLLGVAGLVLWLLKRWVPGLGVPAQEGLIVVLEKKSDMAIGTVAVVSVCGRKLLVVVNKSGTVVHPIDPASA